MSAPFQGAAKNRIRFRTLQCAKSVANVADHSIGSDGKGKSGLKTLKCAYCQASMPVDSLHLMCQCLAVYCAACSVEMLANTKNVPM